MDIAGLDYRARQRGVRPYGVVHFACCGRLDFDYSTSDQAWYAHACTLDWVDRKWTDASDDDRIDHALFCLGVFHRRYWYALL